MPSPDFYQPSVWCFFSWPGRDWRHLPKPFQSVNVELLHCSKLEFVRYYSLHQYFIIELLNNHQWYIACNTLMSHLTSKYMVFSIAICSGCGIDLVTIKLLWIGGEKHECSRPENRKCVSLVYRRCCRCDGRSISWHPDMGRYDISLLVPYRAKIPHPACAGFFML